MDSPEYTLVVVNLVAGFGCAIPVARLIGNVKRTPRRVFRYSAILVGIYFVECVALVTGMGIPVFNVGLAFVWGIVLGSWLRHDHIPTSEALKASLLLSLYSSLPAASFVLVPVLVMLAGWPVLSAGEGARFGIPEFLPWPLSTILGFYVALTIGAVVLKTAITTGEVRLLIRRSSTRVHQPQ